MVLDKFLVRYGIVRKADWREMLSNNPYNIHIKEDGEYILFKYDQFSTDMSIPLARECRGSIYHKDTFECVCRPFDKFFNYGEEFAAKIDWRSARVTEKVDGSLMKVWYDADEWHLSTNGTIDAFKAPVGDDDNLTFGAVFERALGADVQTLGKYLDKDYTYMFELTSPETKIVIPYEDGVYYLAARHTLSGEELFTAPTFGEDVRVLFPKIYNLSRLDDIVAVVSSMPKDEEGVVVNDRYGQRIKVKSLEYLLAARTIAKGNISKRKIFQYIKEEKIDDFLGYAPEKKSDVDEVRQKIFEYCDAAMAEWAEVSSLNFATQKEFALHIKDNMYKGFLFSKAKNTALSPYDYLMGLARDNAYKFLGI